MISHAIIPGRTHRLLQQNSHDFAVTGSPGPGYAFGLVLDGCGSKYGDGTPAHSEVGAKLLGQFGAAYWQQACRDSQPINRERLADFYGKAAAFLEDVTAHIPWTHDGDRVRFVSTHLLATLLGFVVAPKTAVLFWQGDGCLVHNHEVTLLDSNNRPDYLAYRLLRQPDGVAPAAGAAFQARFYPRSESFRLAVATDGWRQEQLRQLTVPQASLQLQRWTNVQARQRGNFDDDGAIAIWWSEQDEKTDDIY